MYNLQTSDAAFEDIHVDLAAAAVMGSEGDTKLVWDPKNETDVESARIMFTSMREKRFLAFRCKGRKGEQGEQIDEFDPNARRLIFVPAFRGG